ncbi:MAG: very short patch repair endonuclease [Candidatus Omnitrophota bacterium]
MDNLTPEQRRKNMQNIRSEGTQPELLIAKELRRQKIYFAKNVKTITGKPDFVFRRKRVVVFVDSDFWHGHRTRCIMPKSNCGYWEQKIARNKQRDRQVTKALKGEGWTVIRLWEKDIKRSLDKSLKKITGVV